jgi:hypothetical protein
MKFFSKTKDLSIANKSESPPSTHSQQSLSVIWTLTSTIRERFFRIFRTTHSTSREKTTPYIEHTSLSTKNTSCDVSIWKLQQAQRYIPKNHAAYRLLFWDLSHVVLSESLSSSTQQSFCLPTKYSADFGAILTEQWSHVIKHISAASQSPISAWAHENQLPLLSSLHPTTIEAYKATIDSKIQHIFHVYMESLVVDPEKLLKIYGLKHDPTGSLLYFFIDAFTPYQLVRYIEDECIGGVSHIFNAGCLQTLLEHVGSEYIEKYPQITPRGNLCVGPYLFEPDLHIPDLDFMNTHLLNQMMTSQDTSHTPESQTQSLFAYAVNHPHETFTLLVCDKFLQFLSQLEKNPFSPQYISSEKTLAAMFQRIAQWTLLWYERVVLAFFQNTWTEGMTQLIKILMTPLEMKPEFAQDIFAWMRKITKDGMVDFADFMFHRTQRIESSPVSLRLSHTPWDSSKPVKKLFY